MSASTSVNCPEAEHDLTGYTAIGSVEEKPPVWDVDELIEQAGGFGRMQWLGIFLATISLHGVGFFIYNLGLLELVPRLE